MASKIPAPPSASRPLQMSRLQPLRERTIKRQLSGEILTSPEKKSRLFNSSSSTQSGSCESLNDKMMPYPSKRPPKAPPAGRLRRSASMASIAMPKKNATIIRRPVLTRANLDAPFNLSGRPSNVTAATIQKNRNMNGPSLRVPVSNITNRVNNSCNETKAKNDATITKQPVKGKAKRPPWDLKGRLLDMEEILKENCTKISDYDTRMASLEKERNTLSEDLAQTKTYSEGAQEEINDLKKQLRNEKNERSSERHDLEQRMKELETQKSSLERQVQNLEAELFAKSQEAVGLKSSVAQLVSFKAGIEAEYASTKLMLERKLKRIEELEAQVESQAASINEMTDKIMEGEMTRRRLHNMVQELKGNIRVFCRVRPLVGEEIDKNGGSDVIHHINFIDEKSLELVKNGIVPPYSLGVDFDLDGSSVSGLRSRNNYEFSFDQVFSQSDSQAVIFEEISQLVQSALDGYNVCVFAYGQTGSGKTFTMEGIYDNEDLEGMIPRTVKHIFRFMDELKSKGWVYEVTASFLEIYNEMIRDLLISPKEAKNNSYEIRLIDGKKPDSYVTNLKVFPVESASRIHHLLAIAQQHRAVAATNMNERSSRSHSVFQLKLKGKNMKTEEACQGTLNLVDLAGSERLKESGSEGARLTETQSINKSLANLGNVIMALAQKQNHIPYRNSKLTHLLQNCLGGNSKTLMFVNVSPLDSCFNETLNSLRFATKVNQCQIGTAVKQVKK